MLHFVIGLWRFLLLFAEEYIMHFTDILLLAVISGFNLFLLFCCSTNATILPALISQLLTKKYALPSATSSQHSMVRTQIRSVHLAVMASYFTWLITLLAAPGKMADHTQGG